MDNRQSHFANHLKDNLHDFDINTGFTILFEHNRNDLLLVFESLEIYRSNNNKNKITSNDQNNFEVSSLIKNFN